MSKNVLLLEKPFMYEGTTYTEFEFDFDRLTGQDMLDIETELEQKGIFIAYQNSSKRYQTMLASKASRIGYDVISKLPLRDFDNVTKRVQYFLLGVDFQDEVQVNGSESNV